MLVWDNADTGLNANKFIGGYNMALEKIQAYMLLNNGTDSQGNVKTVKVNMGQMEVGSFEDSKYLAVADKLENILTKTLVNTQLVTTRNLS